MDILSKSITEPSRDPGGGGGVGSHAPPATNMGAAVGTTGFAIDRLVLRGTKPMLLGDLM